MLTVLDAPRSYLERIAPDYGVSKAEAAELDTSSLRHTIWRLTGSRYYDELADQDRDDYPDDLEGEDE